MTQQTMWSYIGLMVVSALVGQFTYELGAGRVPIPEAWWWLVPILSAGLIALTGALPKMGDPMKKPRKTKPAGTVTVTETVTEIEKEPEPEKLRL